LEAGISGKSYEMRSSLLRPLQIRHGTGEPLRVGDLVVFKPRTIGAYDTMEVFGGRDIPLELGGYYVGVLCERQSGKFVNAQFLSPPILDSSLDLQFISAAGGVGHATGYSVTLAQKHGRGQAGDVEIIGVIIDPKTDRPINTIDSCFKPEMTRGFTLDVPLIIVAGSGADVGKTTTAGALIKELASNYRCAAVKATGTGRRADSNVHLRSGAAYVVNQTDVGLPSTYLMDDMFATGIRQMLRYAAQPNCVTDRLRRPEHRGIRAARPDVIVVELGGDLGEAGIPIVLNDAALVQSTVAIVLCCEGALSLSGALAELRQSAALSAVNPPIYAAVPWGNIEGVHARFSPFVERGEITGLVDILKPECTSEREWRLRYSIHHRNICSTAELVKTLSPALGAVPCCDAARAA
jgi:hypothetical protein